MIGPGLLHQRQGFAVPQRGADLRLSLRADANDVSVARHVMGAFSSALSLPERLIEDLRLAVTEACTNVVRHAYADEPGAMEIAVWSSDARLDVCVTDEGRGMARRGDGEEPGLGLSMIASLADHVSVHRTVHAGRRVAMSFNCRRVGLA